MTKAKWNQVCEGNVHVTDGAEGYWATLRGGVTAQEALDEYMATADYDAVTAAFTVTATVLAGAHEGQMASTVAAPSATPVLEGASSNDVERPRDRRLKKSDPSRRNPLRNVARGL